MPLHRKRKTRHVVDTKSLDETVIGNCLGTHTVRKSRCGLRMQ